MKQQLSRTRYSLLSEFTHSFISCLSASSSSKIHQKIIAFQKRIIDQHITPQPPPSICNNIASSNNTNAAIIIPAATAPSPSIHDDDGGGGGVVSIDIIYSAPPSVRRHHHTTSIHHRRPSSSLLSSALLYLPSRGSGAKHTSFNPSIITRCRWREYYLLCITLPTSSSFTAVT